MSILVSIKGAVSDFSVGGRLLSGLQNELEACCCYCVHNYNTLSWIPLNVEGPLQKLNFADSATVHGSKKGTNNTQTQLDLLNLNMGKFYKPI